MAWAVSISQYQQLRGAIGVAMRLQRGPLTLVQLHHDIVAARTAAPDAGDEVERNNQLLRVSESCWAFLRGIRGTAAYWAAARQQLFAMIRSLGSPTWFLTLSAAETRWDDLFIALSDQELRSDEERRHYLDGLDAAARARLVNSRPVDVARHFDNRWQLLLTWVRSEERPLGNIVDAWWRVEFQRRGSPQIHCMLWDADAPNWRTDEGRAAVPAYIDRYISTVIPDANADAELHALVMQLQQHRHTATCRGDRGDAFCRFNYPRPVCAATRYRLGTDRGLRRADTYLTKRGEDDVHTNPYNPAILRAWRANMDLQLIATGPSGGGGDAGEYAAAAYAAAYVSKSETAGLREGVLRGLEGLPPGATLKRQFERIGTSLLAQREYSLQEATYLLAGLGLKVRLWHGAGGHEGRQR